jgi:glutathione-regulated potassium-efflux system protein KefB
MAVEGYAKELVPIVALLAAGVVAVPLFKRLGLGSVLGYLAAGLVMGPFGFDLFGDPESVLHIAELGVVMFLFVIGLEMQPSHLWSLRKEIFGLGVAQVVVCGAILTGVGILAGLPHAVAFVGAMGFVLSSTAIAVQVLDEQGKTSTPYGQRIVSILLLEDLAIVPLLALVAFVGPATSDSVDASRWVTVGVAIGSLAALLAAGRWLLNPMFRILAGARAREVMTAAALLVVLGAALAMELGGLSMALGAFVAGVLLSESSFRHQLEADIEPFRGILLGLFFMGVGMSLDLSIFAREWQVIVAGVAGYMSLKAVGIYAVARAFKGSHIEAIRRAAVLAQGGEFAFVLYSAAGAAGILDVNTSAILTAIVILSMALTPLALIASRTLFPNRKEVSMEGVERASSAEGEVLIIGFGRFSQVASQALLARGINITIIENDPDMIRSAGNFGFQVFYGDGSRLEDLRTSGAASARAILVCVDDEKTTDRIVELVQHNFPRSQLYVRSYDRRHALALIGKGVEYQVRETFESAMAMGEAALRGLGVTDDDVVTLMTEVRRRDEERLELQIAGGLLAGRSVDRGRFPMPAPLTEPKGPGRALNPEAAQALSDKEAAEREAAS